jgi:hypothetical protein
LGFSAPVFRGIHHSVSLAGYDGVKIGRLTAGVYRTILQISPHIGAAGHGLNWMQLRAPGCLRQQCRNPKQSI